MTQTTYHLTLVNPDGSILSLVEAPSPTRFIHVHDIDGKGGMAELTDNSTPSDSDAAHTTTFARVASAVWVDDERAALYVRVVL